MIIYFSESKVDNLFDEMSIGRLNHVSLLRNYGNIGLKAGLISVTSDIDPSKNGVNTYITKFNKVITKLKKEHRLFIFDEKTNEINPQMYYYLSGKICWAFNKGVYKDGDIIDFQIAVNNLCYPCIIASCSPHNIKIFHHIDGNSDGSINHFLNSLGARLVHSSVDVELILLVTSVNEDMKVIEGSPLIITTKVDERLKIFIK